MLNSGQQYRQTISQQEEKKVKKREGRKEGHLEWFSSKLGRGEGQSQST